MNFEGFAGSPGIYSTVETQENQFWWDLWVSQKWFPAVISGAARDAGNGTTTVLRPGLILGRITSSGKLKEWNPTGTDGSERIFGILSHSQVMTRLGSNQDRMYQVMVGGIVKADRLLIPGQAAYGISGISTEFLIRMQMENRFLFSDLLFGNAAGGNRNVVAKTADYTVTEADNNTIFTNRGASGAVVFTLPTTPKKGLRYTFYAAADNDLTVGGAANVETLVAFKNATADAVAISTSGEKIGGGFEAIADGTSWLIIPINWGAGATAQTVTITDA